MTKRKMTDGERIAQRMLGRTPPTYYWMVESQFVEKTAKDIDRLVRKRMAKVWEEGWSAASWYNKHECDNPYRGRKRKA